MFEISILKLCHKIQIFVFLFTKNMFIFVTLFILLISPVLSGNGKRICQNGLCTVELYVYTHNDASKRLFLEMLPISNELMCTMRDIQITKINFIPNKNYIEYSDIIIHESTSYDIKYPYTSQFNIGMHGMFNGLKQTELSHTSIANTILSFLNANEISYEKRCDDGYGYLNNCQSNNDCGERQSCSIMYDENLIQKSKTRCHRSNIITFIDPPTEVGYHVIFDRSIYNLQYSLTSEIFKYVPSYISEFGLRMKERTYFPKIPINQRDICRYIELSDPQCGTSGQYLRVCPPYSMDNFMELNIHKTRYGYFGYGDSGNDYKPAMLSDVGLQGCTITRGRHIRTCVYIAAEYCLSTINGYISQIMDNPQNFPPKRIHNFDQNIENDIKNYYLNSMSDFDTLFFVTNGKFLMNIQEFDNLKSRMIRTTKKLVIIIIGRNVNYQLDDLAKITNGEIIFVNENVDIHQIKVQVQNRIIKFFAKNSKKKMIHFTNRKSITVHYYNDNMNSNIFIVGSTIQDVRINDANGILKYNSANVIPHTNSMSRSFIAERQGFWRITVNDGQYFETIVLVDDNEITGFTNVKSSSVEIIPYYISTNEIYYSYNYKNRRSTETFNTTKNNNGTFIIPINNNVNKLEIIDKRKVNNPVVNVNINTYEVCNHICQMNKFVNNEEILNDNTNVIYTFETPFDRFNEFIPPQPQETTTHSSANPSKLFFAIFFGIVFSFL